MSYDAQQLWRGRPDTYAQVVSGGQWVPYRWLRFLGQTVANAVARGNGRIIINAPPQHGKSKFISGHVPAWYLDLFPQHRAILATHTSGYAASWGREVRNRIAANPYAVARLSDDSTAADEWMTTEGGGMITAGVGQAIAGRPAELILIDDPIPNWEMAYSAAYRRKCIDWFNADVYTRRQKNTSIILLMTRWHPEDLTGYLLTEHPDRWTHIVLPAVAEQNDVLGRAAGEALCPERFDLESLKPSMARKQVWQALYQQHPTHVGVGLVYDQYGPYTVDDTVRLVKGKPVHWSFDFNINPGMHVEIGQYDDGSDVFTVRHEIHDAGMSLRKALPEAWRVLESYGVGAFPEIHIFGDASGGAKSVKDGRTCYDMIKAFLIEKKANYLIRVPAANPGIRDRVDTYNDALRDPSDVIHYRMHPDCKRLRADFEMLRRDEEGLPDKHADSALSHASDSEGYRVHRLRPVKRAAVNAAKYAKSAGWQAVDVFGG